MATGRSGALAKDLELLQESGTVAGLSDAELLGRFVSRRDAAAEVAFAAIVRRHGPMVLNVCRNVLREASDVDDAFQATFLVLVRKARSVRVADTLGPWLHGVAQRVALKARTAAARRRRHEEPGNAIEKAEEPTQDAAAFDLRPLLHEELGRLPEKYRSPVVLCHLEGKSHEQAARELRWPVGTVSGRLSRARELLRLRLARRGLGVTSASLVAALTSESASAASAVPPALLGSTVLAAMRLAAGGAVTGTVGTLLQGVQSAMFLQKLNVGLVVVPSIAVLALGTGYFLAKGTGAASVAEPGPLPTITLPAPSVAVPTADEPPGNPTVPGREVRASDPSGSRGMMAGQGMMMGMGGGAPPPIQDIPGFPEYTKTLRRNTGGYPGMARGMAGMMAGMAGGGSEPALSNLNANYLQSGTIICVPGKDGEGASVNALSLDQPIGGWQKYPVPAGVKTLPLISGNLLALGVSGEAVSELAVFSPAIGSWTTQKLPAAVRGEFVPQLAPDVALFTVGKDLYACTSGAKTIGWDALHLKGPEAPRVNMGQEAIVVQQGSRLYVYKTKAAHWSEGVEVEPADVKK